MATPVNLESFVKPYANVRNYSGGEGDFQMMMIFTDGNWKLILVPIVHQHQLYQFYQSPTEHIDNTQYFEDGAGGFAENVEVADKRSKKRHSHQNNNNTSRTPPTNPGPPIIHYSNPYGPDGANLFVFHLPNTMTNLDLYNLFHTYGDIVSVRIIVNDQGYTRGFGFVSFLDPNAASAAIVNLNGYKVDGKRLSVQLKRLRSHKRQYNDYYDNSYASFSVTDSETTENYEDAMSHASNTSVGGAPVSLQSVQAEQGRTNEDGDAADQTGR